jgi:hypothetical protein
MRITWSRLSAQERQRATCFEDPVMVDVYRQRRGDLLKASGTKGGVDRMLTLCIQYGVQELDLLEDSPRVHWIPEAGLMSSSIECVFKNAVQTFAEFNELIEKTTLVCRRMLYGEALAGGQTILGRSQRKDAEWWLLGRLFYTTVLLQLYQTQKKETPRKLRCARETRTLAACMAKMHLEQSARNLLAHWTAQCLNGGALRAKAELGDPAAGTLARAPTMQLEEDLLERGWSLRVNRTFYEASELKPAQRRRHSYG